MANSKLIKLVITDIDGVWTDGGMYYTAEGDVMKRFSVKDGWGVSFLHKAGIPVAILTGENTPIVQRRAEKLKIDYCFLGIKDKVAQAEARNNCVCAVDIVPQSGVHDSAVLAGVSRAVRRWRCRGVRVSRADEEAAVRGRCA